MELRLFVVIVLKSSYKPKTKKSQTAATKMSDTTALEDMVRMLVQERASREEEIATERKLRQAEMEQWERL